MNSWRLLFRFVSVTSKTLEYYAFFFFFFLPVYALTICGFTVLTHECFKRNSENVKTNYSETVNSMDVYIKNMWKSRSCDDNILYVKMCMLNFFCVFYILMNTVLAAITLNAYRIIRNRRALFVVNVLFCLSYRVHKSDIKSVENYY